MKIFNVTVKFNSGSIQDQTTFVSAKTLDDAIKVVFDIFYNINFIIIG